MVIPRGESPGVGNVIVEYPSIQQAASAAVQLLQAALRTGHQPADRLPPREDRHGYDRVHRLRW